MRLDNTEINALKYAFRDFKGEIYLFGSRVDNNKRGGDIDIIIFPEKKIDQFKMKIKIQKDFFLKCEENLDVVIYNENDLFCKEIIKNAERLTL